MAFSFAMLAPVSLLHGWEQYRRTLVKQWGGILSIGAFITLNNIPCLTSRCPSTNYPVRAPSCPSCTLFQFFAVGSSAA